MSILPRNAWGEIALPVLSHRFPWLATVTPPYCSEECAWEGWNRTTRGFHDPQWVAGFMLSPDRECTWCKCKQKHA